MPWLLLPRRVGGWRGGRLTKRQTQCKDIPDRPILEFLASLPVSEWGDVRVWCTHWPDKGLAMPSVASAMPPDLPEKLYLAKMRMLLRRGLVDGCGCGCRGDWHITEKGRVWLGGA